MEDGRQTKDIQSPNEMPLGVVDIIGITSSSIDCLVYISDFKMGIITTLVVMGGACMHPYKRPGSFDPKASGSWYICRSF